MSTPFYGRIGGVIDFKDIFPYITIPVLADTVMLFKDDQWFVCCFYDIFESEYILIDNYKNVYSVGRGLFFGYYREHHESLWPARDIYKYFPLPERKFRKPMTDEEIDKVRFIYDKRSMVDIMSRI
jgi:hypothetical protein